MLCKHLIRRTLHGRFVMRPWSSAVEQKNKTEHFDLIVIGGGSGGSATSKRAAAYGKKVCIIEKGPQRDADGNRTGAGYGGTCVNVGCVPKKLMFSAAQLREHMVGSAEIASGYGFGEAASQVGEMRCDWGGLKTRRDAYVARLNDMYKTGWAAAGVTVVTGSARLSGGSDDSKNNEVEVTHADGTISTVTSDDVLVAVGGVPATPDIPGSELGITSDSFFDLTTQPKKCAVFGAGYIAVEMAGILNALGTDTRLFCRGHKVLRNEHVFDDRITDILMSEMAKHGPRVHSQATPKAITKESDGHFSVHLQDGKVATGFDCVLWAIGRKPVTAGIGLEEAGVTMRGGFIEVDEYECTSSPHVYALGDATTTGWELTPVAIAAGRRLADRLYGGEPRARMVYQDVPTVIFSHPPIAQVGHTEASAIAEFGAEDILVRQSTFSPMLYAFNEDDDHKVKTGLKLVLQGPEERVVGLHMIGPSSDEMLQGFAVAVKMGATRRDFEATCAIHPTISEEMVTFAGWGQKDGKPQLPRQIE